MFSKFNLKLYDTDFSEYYEDGKALYERIETEFKGSLDKFIDTNGVINGSNLKESWFPTENEYDIFLSHSHSDKKQTIALAGYLSEELGLSVFIDSCLWGYSNNLLKEIDKKYCRHSNGELYDYDKRNYSTSHVHMMLNIALNSMIDKCESVFFLNTNNSISVEDDINTQRTMSPWIYSELSAANIIRIKDISEYRKNYKWIRFSEQREIYHALNENQGLSISYNVDDLIKGLVDITKDDILEMKSNSMKQSSAYTPLDYLYINKNLITVTSAIK